MNLFCSDCLANGKPTVPAFYMIDGDSLCSEHANAAVESHKEIALAREQLHASGGRVSRRG